MAQSNHPISFGLGTTRTKNARLDLKNLSKEALLLFKIDQLKKRESRFSSKIQESLNPPPSLEKMIAESHVYQSMGQGETPNIQDIVGMNMPELETHEGKNDIEFLKKNSQLLQKKLQELLSLAKSQGLLGLSNYYHPKRVEYRAFLLKHYPTPTLLISHKLINFLNKLTDWPNKAFDSKR